MVDMASVPPTETDDRPLFRPGEAGSPIRPARSERIVGPGDSRLLQAPVHECRAPLDPVFPLSLDVTALRRGLLNVRAGVDILHDSRIVLRAGGRIDAELAAGRSNPLRRGIQQIENRDR